MNSDTSEVIDSFTGEHFFLSNFYPAPLEFGGFVFPTSEHAYQAAKSSDINIWRRFTKIPHPGQAKKYGRQIEVRPNWEKEKINVMRKVLNNKFRDNEDLLQMLYNTGSAKLVEGNTWGDRFWGVCDGRGLNNLGILLMEIRDDPFRLL